MNEAKAIREELAYIGRYQTGISPKLAKWGELEQRRLVLKKRLKQLSDKQSGSNPSALPKKYKAGKKFLSPTASPDCTLELKHRGVDRLANRTNIK